MSYIFNIYLNCRMVELALTATFTTQTINNESVFSLQFEGDKLVDLENNSILQEIGECILYSDKPVLMDFSKTKIIDSTSLEAIAKISENARELNKDIKFKFSPKIIDLIGAMGLPARVDIL